MSTQQLNEIHSLLLLSILEFAQIPGQADKMILKLPLTCFGINARHQEIEERTEGFNFNQLAEPLTYCCQWVGFSNFKKSINLNQYQKSIKIFSLFSYMIIY